MLKDLNTTRTIYNACFRNSSASDPADQNNFRDPIVVSQAGETVLVVPQTPTPNTRQIMIGISASGACDLILRKYFSAGSGYVEENFAIGAAGTYAFESVDALDSCELYAFGDPMLLDVYLFGILIARP